MTRWREDPTRDDWGSYIFLRDVEQRRGLVGDLQPTRRAARPLRRDFGEDRAEFVRRDGALPRPLEVVVSPEDDAEVRRVSLTNGGGRAREIELTSYAEIVLAPPAADAAHPAFSKLFVETEFLPSRAPSWRRAAPRPGEPELGRSPAVVEGETLGESNSRPTAPAFSAAAATSATPRRSTGGAFRTPPARCSTRSSPCAGA